MAVAEPGYAYIVDIYNVTETTAQVKVGVEQGGYPIQSIALAAGNAPWDRTLPYPQYAFQGDPSNLSNIALNKDPVDGFWYGTLIQLSPNTVVYVTPLLVEDQAETNNIHWGAEGAFTTQIEQVDNPDQAEEVAVKPKESEHKRLTFKIELLDNTDKIIEEKTPKLQDGKIDVGSGGYRRKASFTIYEPLPELWQSYRWKLHYGYISSLTNEAVYFPLGVYIPINPSEKEINGRTIVNYQAVDKTKLFSDFEIDAPVTFAAPQEVRAIIRTVAGWVGETKINLDKFIGTIEVARTFEEGTTAKTILDTIVGGFSAEWFFDVEGYLVARKNVDPLDRPVAYVLDDEERPVYLDASRETDDSNYYNKVTVAGGTADTPIYRISIKDYDAIARAGGRIVSKFFKIDAAVTQAMVDGRAAFYLSGGVQLPVTLDLNTLVIPNLELGDIVTKEGIKYEVRSFDVPLGTSSQTIKAGKALETNKRLQDLILLSDTAGIAAQTIVLNNLITRRDAAYQDWQTKKAVSDVTISKYDNDVTSAAKKLYTALVKQVKDQQDMLVQLNEIKASR
jgi:hypothetical protein